MLRSSTQIAPPTEYVEFAPCGTRLITQSGAVWNLRTGEQELALKHPLPRPEIVEARFSGDGEMIATAGADGTARLWSAHTGALKAIFGTHAHEVSHVVFSGPTQGVLVTIARADVCVWRAATAQLLKRFRVLPTLDECFVWIQEDAPTNLVAHCCGYERVISLETGLTVQERFDAPPIPGSQMKMLGKQKRLVVGMNPRSRHLGLVDRQTGTRCRVPHTTAAPVHDFFASQNGVLTVVHDDGVVNRWDVQELTNHLR